MKKTIIIFALTLLMTFGLASIASATVYTNQQWYVINGQNVLGKTVTLTAANKEYTQLSINMSDIENGVVWLELWKVENNSHIWYGNNQSFNYGQGQRAWWLGDTTNNRDYFIGSYSACEQVTVSGWLRNYQ